MTNFNMYDDRGEKKSKNAHNMSHKNIFPYNMGDIVPFFFDDVVPGDEIELDLNLFGRFSPLVTAQMSEIETNVRYFFVPYRLLYKDFNQFYMRGAETVSGADEMPYIEIANETEFAEFYNRYSAIYRHFGLADINDNTLINTDIENYPDKINILPLRAYNQIYYHYYIPLDVINLSSKAVSLQNTLLEDNDDVVSFAWLKANEGTYLKNCNVLGDKRGYYQAFNYGDFYSQVKGDFNVSDISIGATMSSFKLGRSMQKFFDTVLGAKGRFRKYSNLLFGTGPNSEVDRPVYLGGNSTSALIGDVHATTEDTGQPLGAFAGKGTSYVKNSIKFMAKEFGYVVGLVDMTPKVQYGKIEHERISGIEYMDIYRPEFENAFINEVLEKHAYRDYTDAAATPSATYGYSVPYNQYRFPRNMSFGPLIDTLSYWNVIVAENLDMIKKGIGTIVDHSGAIPDETDYWYEITKDLFAVPSEDQVFIEAYNGFRKKSVIKHELSAILSQ